MAACIMLAGGLRPSPLMRATGRSVLDLWITERETVLDRWMRKLAEVREDSNGAWPLRIIHDAVLPPPWPPEARPETVRIELEPTPLRGPAGLLRDVCLRYPNASHVLVVEAARAFAGSLGRLIERHLASGADATVAANADGSPAGVYIIRCAALGVVPAIGFMDLKEQWLGRAQSAGFTMRIEKMRETMSHQLRDRRQFLAAAAALRDGASSRSIICRGAQVLPGAIVRESVVMAGAVVESGATVSRSLICPDTRVQAGRDLADSVITADVAFAGDCAQAGRLETAATE